MRAVLCGANGAMGKLIDARLGDQVVGRVSIDGENGVCTHFSQLPPLDVDMVIDFSHHTAVNDVLEYAKSRGAAVVIGTTGHTDVEKALIRTAAQDIPVFFSGNMSLGIAVLCRLAKEAAAFFPDADIEILEIHHNRKVDAPSGTAKMLFHALQEVRPQAAAHCGRVGEGRRKKNEIGIQSLRMGNVVGVHEVHIATGSQTLTLRHEAGDRGMLADGAVDAAKFLLGKPKGLYDMSHLLEG
ncbi:MAG TPA: 4-hydroxy-tetrahydrodipicolinate reductase [Candidatus Faecousia intestinigallinarum]|nr:4-hydroxy-tetrahydrodipicolinate reductase [Candidatus Faecousia intestinigallinarum]